MFRTFRALNLLPEVLAMHKAQPKNQSTAEQNKAKTGLRTAEATKPDNGLKSGQPGKGVIRK